MSMKASEDKLREQLADKLEWYSRYRERGQDDDMDRAFDGILALIRTEKLKLLVEVRERVIEQAKPDKRKATSWQQGIEVSAYEDAVRVYEYKMDEQLTKLEAEL